MAASAAGYLSIAAAQLRFVAVALAAVIGGAETNNYFASTAATSPEIGGEEGEERGTREEPGFPMSAAVSERGEGGRQRQFYVAAGGCSGAMVAEGSTGQGSPGGCHPGREGQAEAEESGAKELVGLVEALWSSGCLEACVHILGETVGPVRFVCLLT